MNQRQIANIKANNRRIELFPFITKQKVLCTKRSGLYSCLFA
ncbi:hypothetical protein GXM_03034 [Nostoc sphaeroides CCNUC1]|uniref:Uncharacterized protein n=1 Tax=Nostoc sphaeroides CCNUC1 TaxID=2653204 RepID=A0A5P8VYU4_9NOSO|nr:hypothetical protein GXM_03034 [Nostoc sphaeroides CCNUC1]